jgi:hypothetical protein
MPGPLRNGLAPPGLPPEAARQFAARLAGAALAQASAADALAGALHIVDIVARVAEQALAWDTVAVPFGPALIAAARDGLAPGAGA